MENRKKKRGKIGTIFVRGGLNFSESSEEEKECVHWAAIVKPESEYTQK